MEESTGRGGRLQLALTGWMCLGIYKPNIAINWLVCTMWNSERVWGMKWQQLLCVAV